MLHISNYITEKLSLRKGVQRAEHDMFFVIPRSNIFIECMQKYKGHGKRAYAYDNHNHSEVGFILWKPDIKYFLKKYNDIISKNSEMFCIYDIPYDYKTTDTFLDDLENEKLHIEDLEKLDNEDFR